jgi:hypothetical protein
MSATRRIVRSIWETLWVQRDQVTFKADCDRGSLTLVVSTIPPGGGPPPRVHHQQEEAHYMLEPPIRSRRRQLVAIIDTFVTSARRAGSFETLAAWCESLLAALRARWPEASEEIPLYPAFH